MKPSAHKPIKPFYLFAIASYMLTQAILLVLGAAANFTAFPSLMHYHAFDGTNVLFSWNFSDDGTLPHMLMLWGLGAVLFAAIFWLFLHFGTEAECADAQPDVPDTDETDSFHSECGRTEPDAPDSPVSVPSAGVRRPAAPYTAAPVYHHPVSDDGTGLGVVALICGLIAFIPGLGLFFAVAAIICGALGNMRAAAAGNSSGRTLCIIGIALAAIALLLMISTVVFLGSLFSALFGTMV